MKRGKSKDIKLDIAEARKRYLIQSKEFREKRLKSVLGEKRKPLGKAPKLVNYG
jgi:hypothetical protein